MFVFRMYFYLTTCFILFVSLAQNLNCFICSKSRGRCCVKVKHLRNKEQEKKRLYALSFAGATCKLAGVRSSRHAGSLPRYGLRSIPSMHRNSLSGYTYTVWTSKSDGWDGRTLSLKSRMMYIERILYFNVDTHWVSNPEKFRYRKRGVS